MFPCGFWRRNAVSRASARYCGGDQPRGFCALALAAGHRIAQPVKRVGRGWHRSDLRRRDFASPRFRRPCGRTRIDIADDRLSAALNVDPLDRDLLLTLAAVLVERRQLLRVQRHELLGMLQFHIAPHDGLCGQHRPPLAFHGRRVCADHLGDQQGFETIGRLDRVELDRAP